MSTLPPVPPDWLVKIATSAIKSVPDISQRLVSRLQGKLIPLDFAVFGYAGTGKTTLLNRMQYGVPTSPDPTTKMEELDEFEVYVIGRGNQRIKGIYDVTGRPQEAGASSQDDYQWPDWEKVFLGQTPRGIIFLVDHLNTDKSKIALRYVIDMIEQADEPESNWLLRTIFGRRRWKARKNLKVFFLLVNKLDLWPRGLTMGEILKDYTKEIEDINEMMRRNKGRFYMDEISALTGTNFERVLQNFMLGLLAVSVKR